MTGWRWYEVEDMFVTDVGPLLDWWRRYPPMIYAGAAEKGSGIEHNHDDRVLTDDDLIGILGAQAWPKKRQAST